MIHGSNERARESDEGITRLGRIFGSISQMKGPVSCEGIINQVSGVLELSKAENQEGISWGLGRVLSPTSCMGHEGKKGVKRPTGSKEGERSLWFLHGECPILEIEEESIA